jgi:hypothetical protein
MKRLLAVVAALLFVSVSAFAEPAAVGRSLSVRTFQFKHKQADKAAAVIKGLMSADGSMSIQPTANSLVVTDAPENLKKIATALADFDSVAQPFRLSIRLVSASRAPNGASPKITDDVKDVAPKLSLLRYNVLEGLGSADVAGKEGEPGVVELNGYRAEFRFGDYDPASDSIKISDFKLSRLEGDQLAPMMKTTLNLKLGQTVIIGATKQPQSQRALMIVVAARR